MDKKLSLKFRICFDGYDLKKANEKDVFGLTKTLEAEFKNYLSGLNFQLDKFELFCDEKKLRCMTLEVYSDIPDITLKSMISYERLQNIMLQETSYFIKRVFNEYNKRSIIKYFPAGEFDKAKESEKKAAPPKIKADGPDEEEDYIKKTAARFVPIAPVYKFDRLVISNDVRDKIDIALSVLEHSNLVFEQWGLKVIEPFPRAILNFYGPPGTGKTMAGHAIANKLGKKLLVVGCPEIQSKYHGEGPKNVKAVFYAAEKNDAILFFDEADALLSKRLEEVNTGAEDEINNMRNAMLTCLETHRGIVIFASNFIKRYDYAFETRVQSVEFPLPDINAREQIWANHFIKTIPRNGEVDIRRLAEKTEHFCGRDIKNAVIKACFTAVHSKAMSISEQDLLNACDNIVSERKKMKSADYSNSGLGDEQLQQKQFTLKEIVERSTSEWQKRYLGGIPLSDELIIQNIVELAVAMNDRDIRTAISTACFSASKAGREKLEESDFVFGLNKAMKNGSNEDDDIIKASLQEAVDRYYHRN